MFIILGLVFVNSNIKNNGEANNKIITDYLKIYKVNSANIMKMGAYNDIRYKSEVEGKKGNFGSYNTYDLFKKIIKNTQFQVDEQEIAEYSVQIVNDYKEIANIKEKDLYTYYTDELHYSKDEFYDKCYNQGLYEIQRILLIGKISDIEKIYVTHKDITDYLEKNNISEVSYNKSKRMKTEIDYFILEDKVIKYLKNSNKLIDN